MSFCHFLFCVLLPFFFFFFLFFFFFFFFLLFLDLFFYCLFALISFYVAIQALQICYPYVITLSSDTTLKTHHMHTGECVAVWERDINAMFHSLHVEPHGQCAVIRYHPAANGLLDFLSKSMCIISLILCCIFIL